MEKTIIFNGQKTKESNFNFDVIIKSLKSRLNYMHDLSEDDIIDFFDKLVDYWQESGLLKKHSYLKNLSEFFDKGNFSEKLNIALHNNYKALDGFVDLGDKGLLFHAQPRGLTCHWLAGNVPVLGLFSIFFCLATKNVCLVKAPLRGFEELTGLLETLNEVKTEKIDGRDFSKSVAVLLIENNDKESHEKLSAIADVRIAWGGLDAVNAIIGLKKNLFCEDIIFGPKYSYVLIDKESLEKNQKNLVQRLAVDVSVFDQYACSSPHTVFIQEAEPGQAENFAKELASQLELVNRVLLPKIEKDPAKSAEIISMRAEYELKGKVFNSPGTEWTVIYTKESGLAKGCGSRVIFVKPIKDLKSIRDYNNRQKQTLGTGLTQENKLKYLDSITQKGIDRCPNLGYMTFYESPWDGMFVLDRLVRWVTTYKDI